jgi:hypothetical protein
VGWRTVATGAAVRALLASLVLCAIAPGVAAAATFAFVSEPGLESNQVAPTFTFQGPAADSTYSCKLDTNAVVASCPSPRTTSPLSEGSHQGPQGLPRLLHPPRRPRDELATVNLDAPGHSGDFDLIDVPLPARRVERDGMGDLVIRAASGEPRISGIGVTN